MGEGEEDINSHSRHRTRQRNDGDTTSVTRIDRRQRHKSRSSVTNRSSSHKTSRPRHHARGGYTEPAHDRPATVGELRKLRLDYHSKTPKEQRKAAMKYIYEPRDSAQTAQHGKKSGSIRRSATTTTKKAVGADSGRRRRHRQAPRSVKGDDGEYVYRQPSSANVKEIPVQEEEVSVRQSTTASAASAERRYGGSIRRSKTTKTSSRTTGSSHTSQRDGRSVEQQRSRASRTSATASRLESVAEGHDLSRAQRSKSTRHSELERPGLRRSATTARPNADPRPVKRAGPVRANTDPAVKEERKSSSLFASLFGSASTKQAPEKKITCLTCMDDDIPISKSAKLACGHRMCRNCLKRVFKLSVTDPAHMPPKCCTSEHIPLKHVDKLFDMKFKIKWNRKYQEYMTRNRIYCPARRCGEWIKPSHIMIENGRKVGTCKRCHTRVCCLCNNKMHKSRECPKDEATNQFIETAKQEGWQRCFNCKAMVELKEGCNHMTCRCTAEFCMICGAKWKTCDCPWFNYNAVEADRLMHMNIPEARRAYANGDGRAHLRYQEEIDRRREQERRDESLARRMQAWGLGDDPEDGPDHVGVVGIGNAGDHFLNQNFVQAARNVLAGDFQGARRAADALLNGVVTGRENPLPPSPFDFQPAAGQPIAGMRHHHNPATRAYNADPTTRPSERVVPARRHTDYLAEAAQHQPLGQTEMRSTEPAAQRPSLARRNTQMGSNRVSTLIRSADPSTNETDRRIENWRNDVVLGA